MHGTLNIALLVAGSSHQLLVATEDGSCMRAVLLGPPWEPIQIHERTRFPAIPGERTLFLALHAWLVYELLQCRACRPLPTRPWAPVEDVEWARERRECEVVPHWAIYIFPLGCMRCTPRVGPPGQCECADLLPCVWTARTCLFTWGLWKWTRCSSSSWDRLGPRGALYGCGFWRRACSDWVVEKNTEWECTRY